MATKESDPRYVPGISEVDDDMTDAEWVESIGPLVQIAETPLAGLVVNTDGTTAPFDMSTGLSGLQAAVGGYIESVDFGNPLIFAYVNEDGIADELDLNIVATALHRQAFGAFSNPIYGPAVFYGGADDEGNSIGLNLEVAEVLVGLANASKGW